MPALHIRISSRSWWNFWDAALTDERDERSISMNVREAVGVVFLTSAISALAAWALRPLK